MANRDHLRILKKGVKAWNKWRDEHEEIKPDLKDANLSQLNLRGINLIGAFLNRVSLIESNLSASYLSGAILIGANMHSTNLIEANLIGTNLGSVHLFKSNLTRANLTQTILSGTVANSANFDKAICMSTIFAGVDLSEAVGLEGIAHAGPSVIDVNTLFMSQGKIPEVFLRGCGVPEIYITYAPSLTEKAIDFYSCFISYSHADKDFARRLHDRLQGEGIRCWLDEHQLNPGDALHPTIYEAIRVYDKVILCCSQTSLNSWWVDKEFSRAIRKEEDYGGYVLVPLNLDGYLFTPHCQGWIADEIKQRLVADLTEWKSHDKFEQGIKTVIKALRTDGGNMPPPQPKLKPKQ